MNRAKPFMRHFRLASALTRAAVTAALISCAGCDKEDTIRVYNAPKEVVPPPPVTPVASKPIDFSVPKGWTEGEPSSKEYARFHVAAVDPKGIATVSTLPTQAGMLLPNVIRWERQLKLPESEESELGNLVKDIDLPGGKAQLVDLTGQEPVAAGGARQRIVAVILPHGEQTWYLKLAGPVPLVEAQRSNFDAFIKSIQFPTEGDRDAGGSGSAEAAAPAVPAPPPDATTEPAQPPETLTQWTAPSDWKQEDVKPDSPRLLSFKITPSDKPGDQAEVAVTRMAVTNLDVLLQDVNIWRGQVGLAPEANLNRNDARQVTLGGNNIALFDFAGPKADKPEKRIVVALVIRESGLWFFKITGSAGLVAAQRPGFLSLVESAKFAPSGVP